MICGVLLGVAGFGDMASVWVERLPLVGLGGGERPKGVYCAVDLSPSGRSIFRRMIRLSFVSLGYNAAWNKEGMMGLLYLEKIREWW